MTTSSATASRVDLFPDAAHVPPGHRRVQAWFRSPGSRQLRTFLAIGVMSTLAYVVLYAGLRSAMSAAVSNALALLLTAIGNTAANRRLTFDIRGRDGLARHHLAGLAAFGIALAITSASIGLLQAAVPHPGRALELAVLVAANALATLVRFILLRSWIDRGQAVSPQTVSPVPARAAERISR
jgi:putative flippase GtrA